MKFRKSFREYLIKKQVIIIEDIVTTGNSIIKTAQTILSHGGNVIAAFYIWNRDENLNNLFVNNNIISLYSLIKKNIPS